MNEIERVITTQVRETVAYPVAAPVPDILKLDAMECPQDFPPALRAGWLESLSEVALNRYPPARNEALESALRERFAISERHGLLFGNGSDELIQIITIACAKPGAVILAPAPTFVMYRLCATFLGLDYVGVDVREDFSLDVPALLDAIAIHRPAVIYLATPNNPTGTAYENHAVQRIVDAAPGLVVIDEAYLPYSDHSAQALCDSNDNVLMMRTLSKTALAGLRFGYLFGPRPWLEELNKVRLPYNVNVLTQASIAYAMKHFSALNAQCVEIVAERERLYTILSRWQECAVRPSQANFLILKVPDARAWFERLKAQGVLVKNMHGVHPLLDDCLRLTVSNAKENRRLLDALERCR